MADETDSLRSSLLDRVAGGHANSRLAGRQTLDELVASVHRDLEKLLNTRWRILDWPPNLKQLERSLVNYGIPDFAGINMSSTEAREEFREMVEEAIRIHETRFIRVHVEINDNDDPIDRTLRFTINALLRASPVPAEVQFDSQVEPTSNRIKVDEKTA